MKRDVLKKGLIQVPSQQLAELLKILTVDIVEGADFLAVDIQYGSHIALRVFEGNDYFGTGEG